MILDVIVQDKKKRLIAQKELIREEQMKAQALACNRTSISFYDALARNGLSVIGEFKKASPSHGTMHSQISLKERIKQYNQAVDAISCLTEEDHFHGSIEDLKAIREMTQLPILRKDFIIDPYQVYEAKIIGADAILLIAAILDDATFDSLYALARDLGMDVLCEVHDEAELERMLNKNVSILGINNRNLNDFSVSLDTTKRLSQIASNYPDGKRLLVSESGVTTDDDIRLLSECSVNALLIGTALMEATSPHDLAAGWKQIYNQRYGK